MKREQGFTLIELIVAIGLGLLLSMAAVQLFVANQVSFNFQRSTGDVQASGRYAIDQIAADLRMAGLVNQGQVPVSSIVMFTSDVPGLSSTSYVSADNVSQSGATPTSGIGSADQITLQYAMPVDGIDCQGNTVTQGTYLVERYFIRDDPDIPNTKSLACSSGTYSFAGTVTMSTSSTVLASGVDSFKVLYGLDDGVNGVAQVARWVSAGTYQAMAVPRPAVIAVRVAIYLKSGEAVGNGIAPQAAVWVLNNQIPAASIPADNRLRRLFVTTAALNNVDPLGV